MSQATPITVGILLFGGESRRMGEPKWRLPFGAETMLDRIARTMSAVVDALILVGPADGELPALALSGVRVVIDAFVAHFRGRFRTVDDALRPAEVARSLELVATKFDDPVWTARVP